jgi:hypothetical protein
MSEMWRWVLILHACCVSATRSKGVLIVTDVLNSDYMLFDWEQVSYLINYSYLPLMFDLMYVVPHS